MLSSRSVPWNNDHFTIGLGVNALSGEALTGAIPDPCKLQSRAELDKRPSTGRSHAELYLIHRSEDYAKAFGFASDVHGGAYFGGWGVKLAGTQLQLVMNCLLLALSSMLHILSPLAAGAAFEKAVCLTTTSLVVTRMAKLVSEPLLADEGCAELQLSPVPHKVLRQRGPVEFARRWGTHYINGYKKAVFYAVVINTNFSSSEKRSSASAHVGADVRLLCLFCKTHWNMCYGIMNM